MIKEARSDVWNPMVQLINTTKKPEVKIKAEALLRQYNTAGGQMIKKELDFFLQEHGF